MKQVIINKEKCIGCGKCVSDCVSEKLTLINGKAEFLFDRCIKCGHCYAICPVNAITISGYSIYPDEKPVLLSEFDSDMLLTAMKSRRSVRRFRDEQVSDEVIEKIIEAGRYCPTGTNAQDYSFTVIKNDMEFFEKEAVKLFRNGQKVGSSIIKYIRNTTIDDNFFFKKAPLVIVVNGKSKTSACLASSYMELMAESLGLGVFYSGFFIAAAKISRKISRNLNTPDGHVPVTCLVIGYPDVEYMRIPPREAPKVNIL